MAIALPGAPASLLCDNGAVFTATPRGGKVLLQVELERPGDSGKAYGAQVKARPPGSPSAEAHFRVRQDKVDVGGVIALRHDSRLHHIGISRAHKGRLVKLLIADRDIRVLDQSTGELIRRLTLHPSRDYQRIGGD